MSRMSYIQEKLNRFAIDSGLEFRICWDMNIQRWIFRFENRKFKLGQVLSLSDTDIFMTDPDYLVGWIINQVTRKTS